MCAHELGYYTDGRIDALDALVRKDSISVCERKRLDERDPVNMTAHEASSPPAFMSDASSTGEPWQKNTSGKDSTFSHTLVGILFGVNMTLENTDQVLCSKRFYKIVNI